MRPASWLALALLLPWLAWAVVRTLGLERGLIVPAMTFTPYVGLASPVPLVVALLLRRWVVAAVAAAVVLAFALALLPRAIAGPRPAVPGGVPMRVMAINLFLGAGDPRTVVALARSRRVDALALEEVPPAELARLERAGLRRVLPYRQYDPAGGGGSGSALFTRRPMRRLPSVNPRPQQGEPRALVRVPGAMPVDLQVVHPLPPINDDWRGVWTAMLGALARPAAHAATLRMLAGDFNATLDHAQLRALLGDDGYVDAADAVGKGYDTTWPAGRRFPPEITIDHVLVDPRVRTEDVSVHTVPGSDHRAIIATLLLPRAATQLVPRAPR